MRKIKMQKLVDDLTIALLRMNQSMNQRVDGLEARVTALEEELDRTKAKLNEELPSNASALLQEGIDSIMGYQWPPAKGGNG